MNPYTIRPPDNDTVMWTAHRAGMPVASADDEATLMADLAAREPYGPGLPTRADLEAATATTARVMADPQASFADREYAADMEMATFDAWQRTYGVEATADAGLAEVHDLTAYLSLDDAEADLEVGL